MDGATHARLRLLLAVPALVVGLSALVQGPAAARPALAAAAADAPVPHGAMKGVHGPGSLLRHELPARPAEPGSSSGIEALSTGVRLLSYLSMVVLCGGMVFLAFAWPQGAEVAGARRLLWATVATGTAASVVGVWVRRTTVGASGRSGLVGSLVAGETADSEVARLLVVRGLLFLLAIPLLVALATAGRGVLRTPGWLVAAAAVGIGLLRTPGLVSHASEGADGWLGSVADLVHLLGVAVWLGGLVLLCSVVLPRRRPEELAGVAPRYSSLALGAVVAVVVGGALLSWELVGGLDGLTGTRYGHVLLVKLSATVAILVAARFSKSWVDHRLGLVVAAARGAPAQVRPLVASVAVEATLAMVALTAASVLVGISPGR